MFICVKDRCWKYVQNISIQHLIRNSTKTTYQTFKMINVGFFLKETVHTQTWFSVFDLPLTQCIPVSFILKPSQVNPNPKLNVVPVSFTEQALVFRPYWCKENKYVCACTHTQIQVYLFLLLLMQFFWLLWANTCSTHWSGLQLCMKPWLCTPH